MKYYETIKEISILKQALEVIENIESQQTKPTITRESGAHISSEEGRDKTADTQTLIKQALSQRNKEILEILNKYKNTFCDLCEEDYQKLKKQLTNSEGKDVN